MSARKQPQYLAIAGIIVTGTLFVSYLVADLIIEALCFNGHGCLAQGYDSAHTALWLSLWCIMMAGILSGQR